MRTERPLPSEYEEYFERYVKLVPAGDVNELFVEQMNTMNSLLSDMSESAAETSYEEGKWSIKEVAGHLSDAERMLSYLTFRIIRGDSSIIPAINLSEYALQGKYQRRPMLDILEEWKSIRESTLLLFKGLENEDFQKTGTLKNHPISVRASAYILLGHTQHHMNILFERYNL
ncbi:DinB family protein [Bacillus salacetis]|uniref:DinB family protein n=1 Tax=Bacillus salacetis TaxID=2315464 RepID=UPI003B9DD70E